MISLIRLQRVRQVLKYGWSDSALIAAETRKAGKGRSRAALFFDILYCFFRYNVFSLQYRYERMWEMDGEKKRTVAIAIGRKNSCRDEVLLRWNRRRAMIEDEDAVNRMIQTNLSTMQMHQKTFLPYKGIHTGEDVVIVATGPTVKDFKPIPGCKYISVNHAFLDERIDFDYAFAIDYMSLGKVLPCLNNYRKGKCIKFYGLHKECMDETTPNRWGVCEENRLIPESDAIAAGALRFRTDFVPFFGYRAEPTYDLASQPLCTMGSTAFIAMEFALWTNPRRIYIVGCDCSQAGHFYDKSLTQTSNFEKSKSDVYSGMVGSWRKIKRFATRYYPSTEIVSVNPVGLKGLFTDLYQDQGVR